MRALHKKMRYTRKCVTQENALHKKMRYTRKCVTQDKNIYCEP